MPASAEHSKARYDLLKSLNVCVQCGKCDSVEGVRCELCAVVHRDKQKQYRVCAAGFTGNRNTRREYAGMAHHR